MIAVSVSKLVRYLKNKLDSDDRLRSVNVTGELSNFHLHNSGHLYFTLKDEASAINCVMFSSKARLLKFKPKNGDKVEVNATVSIFETSGQLQLYVNSLKKQGLGDLFQQYEELKAKLSAEGYFLDSHKKELTTAYPEKVAVLVGDNSAAMSDIKICFKRRWPLCKVDYYPVLVQGTDAPKEIISKLKEVDNLGYDALILARGGGSFEDLFCFNNEELVKTIYSLNTFIITGIGHEMDFTLSDFVSDLRAPTPTATVELLTPDIKEVKTEILELKNDMFKALNSKISDTRNELNKLADNKYFLNPYLLIENRKMKLDYYSTRLLNYQNKTKQLNLKIENISKEMQIHLKRKIAMSKVRVESMNNVLKMYSIDNTLKRGYSLVYKNNKIISDVDSLQIDDDVNIRMYKGTLGAKVKEITNG